MRRLPVERHLTAGQARARYRACRHPAEKTRWHAIWLLLRPDRRCTPAQVTDVVGLSVIAVRHALRRWNRLGPDGLTDRRRGNGAAPRLTVAQRAALRAALRRRPHDGKVMVYAFGGWGAGGGPLGGGEGAAGPAGAAEVPGAVRDRDQLPAAERGQGADDGQGRVLPAAAGDGPAASAGLGVAEPPGGACAGWG